MRREVAHLLKQEFDLATRIGRHDFDASLLPGGSRGYAVSSGRDKLEKSFANLAKFLLDPETGAIRRDLLQERPCPLCGCADEPRLLFTKYYLDIVSCPDCGFEFCGPALSPGTNAHILETDVFMVDHIKFLSSPTYTHFGTLRYHYQLQLIEEFISAKGHELLDLGCSIGSFLDAARSRGWSTAGIESNAASAGRATAKGHRVFEAEFSGVNADDFGRYDAIVNFDVLEHIHEPKDFLRAIHRALKPGGVLLVQVPNVRSLVVELEGRNNQIYNGLIHVNYFSPESLRTMAEDCGFTLLHSETMLSEMSIAAEHTQEEIDAVLKRRGIEGIKLTPDALLDHDLGYKVTAIFRKGS